MNHAEVNMKKSILAAVLVAAVSFGLWGARPARPGEIVINEAASTGAFDFIELMNVTDETLVLGPAWELADRLESRFDSDTRIAIPEGTVIGPGGFLLFAPWKASGLQAAVPKEIPPEALEFRSFALGSPDEVSLYHNGTLADFISWRTDVNVIARYPDGTGEISTVMAPTPGAPNKPEPRYTGPPILLINEVCSRGLDYVELINVSGREFVAVRNEWRIEDAQKADTFIIPEGTRIPAGGLLLIYPDVLRMPFSAPRGALASSQGNRFGFGGSDSVILRYREEIADLQSWELHVTSAGRLPDGSSNWEPNLFMTPGRPNRK